MASWIRLCCVSFALYTDYFPAKDENLREQLSLAYEK